MQNWEKWKKRLQNKGEMLKIQINVQNKDIKY